MQNCFLVPRFSVLEVPVLRDIVDNVNALAAAVRNGGGLVVWTRYTFRPDWTVWHDHFARGDWRDRMIAQSAEGSFGYQIGERKRPAEGGARLRADPWPPESRR